jgi:3-deoxy-7-phosphoheptulonate synthase
MLGFVERSPAAERYRALAARISDAMDFMAACGITPETTPALTQTDVLHEPRSAAARL